jgi:hypothetical protein
MLLLTVVALMVVIPYPPERVEGKSPEDHIRHPA